MVVTGQLVTVVYVVKLVNSVDSGGGEMVIGVSVEDVTADASAEDTVAEVAFR